MIVHLLCTLPHFNSMQRLLSKRLEQVKCCYQIEQAQQMVSVSIDCADHHSIESFYSALAVVMGRDIARREITSLVNKFSCSHSTKNEILFRSFHHAHLSEQLHALRQKIKSCLQESNPLHLEGFLRFRMQRERLIWRLCIRQSIEEIHLQKELAALMDALHSLLCTLPCRIEHLSLWINADGSYTLADKSGVKLQCTFLSEDHLIALLLRLAPQSLIIHDHSCRNPHPVLKTIQHIFSDRIQMQ